MTFMVGVTRDFQLANGDPCFDPAAFEILKKTTRSPGNGCRRRVTEITPEIAARYDALQDRLLRARVRKVSAVTIAG